MELQKNNEAIFCVVDEHAITVPQEPEQLREKTLEVAMVYLAAGIDPKKSIVFVQSHVPAHTELGWILNTLTPLGELERMTQFKEKKQQKHGTLAGILNYPTLMAADILLYQTEAVPVGEDQIQHIEFTRMIAEKFNSRFGETFRLPRPLLTKETARTMGLDDPTKKMSKSADSRHSYIAILDNPDTIRHKIQSAVTDSETVIKYDPVKKPAISNLLNIYSGFSGKSVEELEKQYASARGYAEFKKDLAEIVIEDLSHLQHRFNELSQDKETVLKILYQGAKKAEKIASKTSSEVKKKMGFVQI